MAFELKYEPSYVGSKLTATRDGAQVATGYHDHATVFSVPKGSYFILTGYVWYDGKYTNHLQTTNGMYIPIDTYTGSNNDWTITNNYTTVRSYSDGSAQKLIDTIIRCNRQILCGVRLCPRLHLHRR